MESLCPEEENIIRNTRNLFTRKKTEAMKVRIIGDIKNLFEYDEEKEKHYKPVRANNVWSNNYIKYESNSDKNKTLSVEDYLNKIRPYSKNINNLKNMTRGPIQLTMLKMLKSM